MAPHKRLRNCHLSVSKCVGGGGDRRVVKEIAKGHYTYPMNMNNILVKAKEVGDRGGWTWAMEKGKREHLQLCQH